MTPTRNSWRTIGGVVLAMALILPLAACDGGTGPEGTAQVSLAFRAADPGASASVAGAHGSPLQAAVQGQGSSLTLSGTNGTLVIDGISLVVAEFELERANEDDCEDPGEDEASDDDASEDDGEDESDDDCEEFEASPQFVQLSLDGESQVVVQQAVPATRYGELGFAVEDLDWGDDEEDEEEELGPLFAEIQSLVPDWPQEASLLVEGSFTPTGGAATDFRVFFDAEIRVEMAFPGQGLDLTEGSEAMATVVLDPSLWFSRPDGTVVDLSRFAGQLPEFEVEIESVSTGFSDIEVELGDD